MFSTRFSIVRNVVLGVCALALLLAAGATAQAQRVSVLNTPNVNAEITAPLGPNLLVNPGFEDGAATAFLGWTFSPSNSSCSRAQHNNAWPFAHTGARFLGTGRTTTYPNCLSVWQEVGTPAQAGQTYTAGFWLRNGVNATPPQSQNVVIALWGVRGDPNEASSRSVTVTDFQWECHQLWFTPQGNHQNLKVEVYLDHTWNTDVHVDDVYLGVGQVQYCPVYAISGQITDAGNVPIAGATVTDSAGHNTTSDANGNYSFANLVPGTYTVTPSQAGVTFSPASRQVTVPPDTTGQNFMAVNRYAITGRVSDAANNSISNVSLDCSNASGVVKTATTDGNGNYVCGNLPPGVYLVRAASGSPYTLSPSVRGWMAVPPNQASQDFRSAPIYGSISGQVNREGTNGPIANATVNVGGKSAQTDGNGNYSISSLLPGTHVFRVTASGYQDHSSSIVIQASLNTAKNALLKPVLAEGFRMPFPGGTTYLVTRVWHCDKNGKNCTYAQDWARNNMNADTLVASRAGKVVGVKEDSNKGKCNSSYVNYANVVTLLHPDNTKTQYVHLKQWSVPVTVGEYVRSGQIIGKSGTTGYSCGEHLHFNYLVNGKRATPNLLDIPGGVPTVRKPYVSGNYFTTLAANQPSLQSTVDITAPLGSLKIQLTGQPTYRVQIETFDYDSDWLLMRLATTEADLPAAPWVTATSVITWSAPVIWGQFKDPSDNVSSVYSDTLEAIAYEPIQAAFAISSTVCAGTQPAVENLTFPLCQQCGWLWNYGDGNTSQAMLGDLPDDESTGVYTQTGTYTLSLTAANINSVSTTSHAVEVVAGPAADFQVVRLGNTITATASASNGTNWLWDFGDETTASGQSVSHTYTSTTTMEASVISLNVSNAIGCSSDGWQPAAFQYKVYLPQIKFQ